jgi:putative Mg2+ transporter-C (MgtC) family protein
MKQGIGRVKMPQHLDAVLRVLLAAALGAAIGAQREWSGKPAGLRTLALIATGSALFGVISEFGFPGE